MKKITLFLLFSLFMMVQVGCDKTKRENGSADAADSTKVEELPELKADEGINKATKFYAGISREGFEMSSTDAAAWDKYSKDIKKYIAMSNKTIEGVDSIARTDFTDFRDKVDYVFYPFSGADFIYPITLYPDADTYFLCGLEKTGSLIDENVKTTYSHYEAYRNGLATFFRASFFITKDMVGDFHNNELDGVCPVLTMLMAVAEYDIISIRYLNLSDSGDFTPAEGKSDVLEFKFFKPGSRHEQTLYYYSCDVSNEFIKENIKAYLSKTLPSHTVGTYIKAASFLMHKEHFSIMRNYVLDYSLSIVEDDSGIPYRMIIDKYDVTLYGKYMFPSKSFDPDKRQMDLNKIYNESKDIHALPFRIGYNNPSNWLVARRKGTKS